MTEIEILTECQDEEVVAAIIATVQLMLKSESKFVKLPRTIRVGVNVPIWNCEARNNNLM